MFLFVRLPVRAGCSLLLTLLCVTTAGCDGRSSKQGREQPWKTIVTKDQYVTIRVPSDWILVEGLSYDGTVFLSSRMAVLLTVTSEPKTGRSSGILTGSAAIQSEQRIAGLGPLPGSQAVTPDGMEPEVFTLGKYRAFKSESTRELEEGIRMRYRFVTVEGPKHTHRIAFASLEELWEENLPVFERVVRSIEERAAPIPEARRRQ